MELNELISAVKAAKDKNELEALVKAELQIDLDKRKSLDTLRAEVLKGLGVEEGEPGDDDAGESGGAAGAGDTAGLHSANEQAELQALRDENARLREENATQLNELQAAQLRINDLQAEVGSLRFQLGNPVNEQVGEASLTPPDLDEVEPREPPVVPDVRLLRNTENGRVIAWSPELAKLPNMKEL
ncbi:hypothetical protein ACT048_20685 [Ectopseudomonas khazarica]|uniref:hypothetical protein n=1 Tax=Ectopseudomonas khazarica TaxID=2502979 RepID=UPI004033E77B